MRKAGLYLSALLVLITCSLAPLQAAGPYDKYLTSADFLKAANMKGVKLIPKDPSQGAGGDLNFATADGNLILMVQIVGQSNYAGYKKMYFKAGGELKGLGEQAFQGTIPPCKSVNLVCFRKGANCVALTAFYDFFTNKAYLTAEQLVALAKVIAGRM